MTFKKVIACDMPGCKAEVPDMNSAIGWIQIAHPDLAETLVAIKVTQRQADKELLADQRVRHVFHFCSAAHLASYIDNLTFNESAEGIPR